MNVQAGEWVSMQTAISETNQSAPLAGTLCVVLCSLIWNDARKDQG